MRSEFIYNNHYKLSMHETRQIVVRPTVGSYFCYTIKIPHVTRIQFCIPALIARTWINIAQSNTPLESHAFSMIFYKFFRI